VFIDRNHFRKRPSLWLHQPQALLLCVMWALPLGCGEDVTPVQTPAATSATLSSEKPTERVNDTSPQLNDEFAPLQTSSSANEPQQDPASSKVEQAGTTGSDDTVAVKVRLPDDRPDLNEARLEQAGIRRYTSRRLILLSDLPEEQVAHLPALTDQLFDRLEMHFGTLPPSIDDSEFQVTGHLISDPQAFHAAGLMPSETFTFDHGRHWNYQFWMFDTADDYYQRHLLLHEFTHCFMTCECGMHRLPAGWYMEGMAEYFATHRFVKDDGLDADVEFGVLPRSFEGFEGWGRISEIRRSFHQQNGTGTPGLRPLTIPTFNDVLPDIATNFTQYSQYATSWAVCWFLQSHPDYRELYRPLAKLRTGAEIATAIERLRRNAQPRINTDWLLFVESLREGYDVERSFPVHSTTIVTADDLKTGTATFKLQAALDWQDSGLRLEAGESVEVKCTGRFSVDDQPQLWISEPQGVSIEYVSGLPLGRVVATLVSNDGESMSSRISVGTGTTITTSQNVSVWLQLNDSSASRSNNAGTVDVEFSRPQL
jgi:hypothetical protein